MSEALPDNLLMEFVQGDTVDSVDRGAFVIRGAKVLGTKSKNPPPHNHLYPQTTRASALPMIEGLAVGINHPAPELASQTRPYQDLNGCLRKPRDGNDGVRADWHLNPKHPLTEQILWDAENNPRNLAFSINARAGSKLQTAEGMVVESIEHFDSVDLVSRGATTNGLFESQRHPMKQAVKTLIESLKAKRPGYSRALKEMAEAGLMSPDQQMDAPAGDAPADDAAGGVDHVDAILTAAAACLRDGSLDSAGKMSKIKKLLAMTEKDEPGPKGGKGGKGEECPPGEKKPDEKKDPGAKGGKGEDDDEDKDAMESLKLQLRARDLLMEASVKPGKVLLKAIAGCKTEAEVTELIEASKGTGQAAHQGARSAAAGISAAGNGTLAEAKIPDKGSDWGKSLVE